MNDRYVIVARVRIIRGMSYEGKREVITNPMSKAEAEQWKPTPTCKRSYKYFRVVKYKN